MTKEEGSRVVVHSLGLPRPHSIPTAQVLPTSLPFPRSGISCLLCASSHVVSVSVHLSPSPSLLPQGVVLRADQSSATARSRGQPRCPSSPSCSSTTSPSSWPRPGPSTASPSSTACRAAAVHSSLAPWLPPRLKSLPQNLQGSLRHPPTEVPGKLGLSQKPHDRHPWAATPLSGALAPLGSAPTLPPPLRAPLPQSRPQPQKAHPHGASPALLSSLPPPSSPRRRIRRH